MPLKIAMSLNIFVGRCAGQEGIARLRAAGFDALDFNWVDLAGEVDWQNEREADAFVERYRAAANDAALPWSQSHGPMFDMFGTDAENQKKIARTPAAIRASGQLGVRWMVMHPDGFAGAFDREHMRRVLEANVRFFRQYLPLCEKWNVGIALENIFDSAARHRGMPRFFGAVPHELCELVDALDHPLIGACWDTGHARLMGLDQRAAIASLGGRLKAVHIQDNNGADDDHLMPLANGSRGVDWQAVADGLRRAGYAGTFTYEAHNSFRRLPEPLFDRALTQSVEIARHIVGLMDQQ